MVRWWRERWSLGRAVALVLLIGPLCVFAVEVASAHPSDLRTLTVELLFGSQGLEVIDAALVGQSYEPFPSCQAQGDGRPTGAGRSQPRWR